MSRATSIIHIQDLGVVLTNSGTIGDYYDGIQLEMGQLPVRTHIDTLAGVGGTRTYAAAQTVIQIFHIFYGSRQVPMTGLRELEAITADWRSQPAAQPIAVNVEGEQHDSFTFYPTPSAGGTITLIVTVAPTDALPWVEPYIMFEALAREFSRESAQLDPKFSMAASFMADLFLKLVL